ncbi:Na(+)-translocating NADH-quinone reductase subunit C [Psychrobacter sp. I-STPA10]|uniref:Na(+)-translocating NADH-quinone reductase subunit C n=1 Tax=Psychrobacter sp. I-STPA10 TaxID=2585769 RepID=UPI001E2FE0B2|nr:Na(+)-translocating NADH-quinone reductase subunit C [Psychrobacter sp. I-STPA10]
MSQSQNKKPSKKNSNLTTIGVALVLCLVCSVLVSAVAVGLKSKQQENSRLDRNKNILMAAGLFDPETDDPAVVEEEFANFETKLVDLETGEFATDEALSADGITDVTAYDTSQAAKNKALSIDLGDDDPAGIGSKPKYAKVYVLNGDSGKPELVVLPVYGYGLWGTIYGFLTIEGDLNTIKGISFYSHKETPGLGARIEEPKWRAQWDGIKAYNDQGEVATGVTKSGNPKENWVDGISGATLTSRGVSNFIQFWLGDQGYKPFLDHLRSKEAGSSNDQARQNSLPNNATVHTGKEA